jgi:hypothetical protein
MVIVIAMAILLKYETLSASLGVPSPVVNGPSPCPLPRGERVEPGAILGE